VTSLVITDKTVLLEYPNSKVLVIEWFPFAGYKLYQKSRSEYYKLWEEFKQDKSVTYYRKNLAKFSPEFAQQLKEFTEGNLLFEVMERKVWNKAANDTAGLRKTYNSNKSKYMWGKSAAAIVVTATDSSLANQTRESVLAKPSDWRNIMETSGGRVMADSGRMDWEQIVPKNADMKNKMATPVQVNHEDQSASFSYIVKTYPSTDQKSFTDSKVQVINDYQAILEERWIAALKKKYPVVVDQKQLSAVISSLSN
jgi:peptidyl-prolyl cis-trans isomerase SurA